MRFVSKALNVPHPFPLPYTSRSNGAVEKLCKEILHTFRAFLTDLQMEFNQYKDLLKIFQSTLNNSKSTHRGNVAPVSVCFEMEPILLIFFFCRTSIYRPVALSNI
eukprot:gb/GEZJ01004650.1/.p2 GENE.gb/GEZJ01004650.1/~~gb/GEZJ01004650.1/.p2  ORF type:complete len:106 (-),score=9.83 gb/GEZJ01004650.1/:422-739(-)